MNERSKIKRDGKWRKDEKGRRSGKSRLKQFTRRFKAINCHSNDSHTRLKLGRPLSPLLNPLLVRRIRGNSTSPSSRNPRNETSGRAALGVHVFKQDGEASIGEKKEGKKTAHARGGRMDVALVRVRAICRSKAQMRQCNVRSGIIPTGFFAGL